MSYDDRAPRDARTAYQTVPMTYRRRGNFTERAYRVVELASAYAEGQGHAVVTPLHIAIGLAREGEGVAATAIQLHGLKLDSLEAELAAELSGIASSAQPTKPQLTAECDALFDQAAAESEELGHLYTGTEHILLVLLRDSDSVTARLLSRHGFSFEMCRARILHILNAGVENPEPFVPPTSV